MKPGIEDLLCLGQVGFGPGIDGTCENELKIENAFMVPMKMSNFPYQVVVAEKS